MFDESIMTTMTKEPVLGHTETWNRFELLAKEKEVLGIYISGHPLDDYALEVHDFCTHQIRDIDLFSNPIQNFTFAGYVQSHSERIGRNDKPYGILMLEDYSGTKEIRLFGEHYIKFRNYFIAGALLYFSAAIVKRSWDGALTLRVNDVHLLSDVSSKFITEINFNVQILDIDEEFSEKLLEIVQKHPGKHKLKLNVFDQQVSLNFYLKTPGKYFC